MPEAALGSMHTHPSRRWFVALVLIAGVLIAERMLRKYYWKTGAIDSSAPNVYAAKPEIAAPDTTSAYHVKANGKDDAALSSTFVPAEADGDEIYDGVVSAEKTMRSDVPVDPPTLDEIRSLAAQQPFLSTNDDDDGFDLRRRGQLEVENAARAQIAAMLPNISDRTAGGTKQLSGTRRLFADPTVFTKLEREDSMPQPDRDFFQVRDQYLREGVSRRFTVDNTNAQYKHPAPETTAFANGDVMTEHMRITSADRPGLYPRQLMRAAPLPSQLQRPDRFDDLQKSNTNQMKTMFREENHFPSYVAPQPVDQFDRGARVVQPQITQEARTRRGDDTTGHFVANLDGRSAYPRHVSADGIAMEPATISGSTSFIGRDVAVTNMVGETSAFGRDIAHVGLRNERTMPDFLVGKTSAGVATLGGGTGPLANASTEFGRYQTALAGGFPSLEQTQRQMNNPRVRPESRQSVNVLENGNLRDTQTHPKDINMLEPRMRVTFKKEMEMEKRTIAAQPDELDRTTKFTYKPLPDTQMRDDYNQRKEIDLAMSPRMSTIIDRVEDYKLPSGNGEMTRLRATRK